MDLVRRLLGFSTLPFLSAVLPLLALPIVARAGGVDGWSAFNVGQAIGTYAAAVGYVGWNVLGTPLVAAAKTKDERIRVYARSFYVRAVSALFIAAAASSLAYAVAPAPSRAVAVSFALAGAVSALGLSWFAIGISSIWVIIWYEIVPRAIATALAIALILLTGDVLWYGILLIVAPLAGLAAFHLVYCGRLIPPWLGWRQVSRDLFDLRSAWGVEVVGNLYANAPVPLVSVVSPVPAAAAYGSSDRLYRYSLLAVAAAGNALQGWVLEVDDDRRARRNTVGIILMTGLGIAGLAGLIVLGIPLSRLLFGAELEAQLPSLVWLGISFFAVAASTPLIRNVLMPARREKAVLAITLASAVLGLAAMVLASVVWGPPGVAAGLAVSELFTLIACGIAARKCGLAVVDARLSSRNRSRGDGAS
ncbi:hypothetical protein DEA06_00605 [Microbacterium sp. Gd 4-13]|nr:hypothetical protein DEA06_00605 [Microbacterium sp. Gd 4-13]